MSIRRFLVRWTLALLVLVLAVLYALRRFALQSVESHATIMGSKLSIPVSIVAAALNEQGVKASNVGGFKDWTAAGLPTRKADEKK